MPDAFPCLNATVRAVGIMLFEESNSENRQVNDETLRGQAAISIPSDDCR